MKKPRIFLLTLTFVWLGWSPLFSQEVPPLKHIGLGLNYGGAQLDLRTSEKWMFEIRGQQGTDKSTNDTKSSVMGIRTYRFLRGAKSFSPYFGAEIAYVEAKQNQTSYDASGMSLGGFGGLGFNLGSRFLLTFDVGPYFISLKEKRTHADTSGVDFVGDTSLIFFF